MLQSFLAFRDVNKLTAHPNSLVAECPSVVSETIGLNLTEAHWPVYVPVPYTATERGGKSRLGALEDGEATPVGPSKT